MDTWFSERSLGRAIAIAREHHTHPENILGYGFLEHSTLGSAPSAVFIGAGVILIALCPVSLVNYMIMMVFLITATCLFFGTSFHNLAHKQTNSALMLWAQKLHLVIRPDHHWVHHRNDQVVRYCVINGWANYPCDKFGFWRGLEWLVKKVTGAKPRMDDLRWQTTISKRLPQPMANKVDPSQTSSISTELGQPPTLFYPEPMGGAVQRDVAVRIARHQQCL